MSHTICICMSDKLYELVKVPRTALEESQNFENAKGWLAMSTDVSGRWTNLWRKQRIKPLKCFDVFGNSVHTINIDHYLTKCSENIILIILICFRTNLEGYEFIRGHLWWGQCQIPWPNSWDRLAWQIHEQALHRLEKFVLMKIMRVEDLALCCYTTSQYRHEHEQIILFFLIINHGFQIIFK